MGSDHFLLDLLKKGQARLTDEGHILVLGEYGILLPIRVFLKLQGLLQKELRDNGKFLYNLGKYQVDEALRRYMKVLKIDKVDRTKIFELFLKIPNVLGLGNLQLKNIDYKKYEATFTVTKLATSEVHLLVNGKSKEPIDHYLSGYIAEGCSAILGKKVECIETKCLACGDPYCQFEVSPKIKPFK